MGLETKGILILGCFGVEQKLSVEIFRMLLLAATIITFGPYKT